jgi:hypothetical protein
MLTYAQVHEDANDTRHVSKEERKMYDADVCSRMLTYAHVC